MDHEQRQAGRRWWANPLVISVNALGLTQITAWGTSYYCLGVLAKPIGAETGWGTGTIFLGFSVALVVMGLISTSVGRLIDRVGARAVMSVGTVIVSAGLLALSQVANVASYLVVWAVIGVGMRCCLYDAAFAALVQVVPSRGRAAISYLTLYGAYASTIFWVIGHYLNDAYGWRSTLLIFAGINLVVCLPLNWLGLTWREAAILPAAAAKTVEAPADEPVLQGRLRLIGIALFALIMSLNGFVFGVVSLQLVSLLEAAGLAGATAVWVASLKGHGQFAGRLVEIFFAKNLRAMTVARIAIGVLPAALVLLMLAHGQLVLLVAFTLLLGASQGVITIVRGAVPLALFGTKGYGAVLGLIATPILLVNAFSPTLFALIVEQIGWQNAFNALLVCAALSWLAIELMSRWYERTRTARRLAAP
ncbi:MAG: MFS transporter [Reyranellaceae bacterium]